MSDELNENLNSQQVADAVLDTQTEAIDSTMDAETLAEKNKQLYARATKAEAEAKELKAKLKIAVEAEDWLWAASIRDKIAEKEKNKKGGSKDSEKNINPDL